MPRLASKLSRSSSLGFFCSGIVDMHFLIFVIKTKSHSVCPPKDGSGMARAPYLVNISQSLPINIIYIWSVLVLRTMRS